MTYDRLSWQVVSGRFRYNLSYLAEIIKLLYAKRTTEKRVAKDSAHLGPTGWAGSWPQTSSNTWWHKCTYGYLRTGRSNLRSKLQKQDWAKHWEHWRTWGQYATGIGGTPMNLFKALRFNKVPTWDSTSTLQLEVPQLVANLPATYNFKTQNKLHILLFLVSSLGSWVSVTDLFPWLPFFRLLRFEPTSKRFLARSHQSQCHSDAAPCQKVETECSPFPNEQQIEEDLCAKVSVVKPGDQCRVEWGREASKPMAIRGQPLSAWSHT